MPILNEKDAILVRDTFDLLSDEEKPLASEWMQKYEAQQNDLGEPLFPSQVQAMSQNREAVRKMFDGIDKVQAEISPWSENPNQDRAVHANMALLSDRYGKKPQEIADRYEFYLNDYAAQKFGMTQGVDDLTFYAAAAKELQREKQKEDTEAEGQKAALRGDDVIPALQAWQAKNLDRMPDSTEFTRGFLQARERAGDQLEFADTLLKQIESNTGLTKGEGATRPAPASRETAAQFEESLATLAAMKPKDRKQVYAIIGAKAESAGYDQKGFWAQMLSELGKGTARMGSTVTTQMGVTGDVLANLPGMLSNTMTEGEFDVTEASIARRQGIGEMYDEVARIVAGEVDPVRPVISWMNDTVETGLIKGPGAVAPFMMASAALGPFGAGALFTADFAEQNRRELRASGMDNAQAVAVGAAAAPLQAVVESLSNALQLGRFPAVQRVLSNFTKPIGGGSGFAVRYLQNAGLSLATEFTEEQLQDNFIVPATQELFGALESDMPQVDWSMYRNRAIESTPELLSILAPMALVFGGTMTSAQANLSSAAISSQDMLEAAGYSAAQANEVRIQPTEEAKISKAREFWGARAGTPQSIETAAKTVGERMRMLQGDAIAAQKDLESRGILPRMLRASESAWKLTFNDGSTADFNSHREADAARWQWATDQLGKVHLATRSALAQLESGAAVGREFAVEFKPDVMTAQMAVEEWRVDPAQIQRRVQQGAAVGESAAEPVNESETFDNAVATDKATSDYLASLQILGSSSNEFKDGVLRTTIRLYEGANVLTLVEEKLEGDAKQIIASKPGREWMLAKLREYERVSGDSLFRKVADDSELQNDDLIEAWSSLGQSYLVGKSKKGAAIGKGGGRRIFADVLKAGMAGAMNSETQFFNAVWRRAAKLSKLKREGKLGDDLTAELERQLGIDSQAKFENESAAEAEAIANEALNTGGVSYSEASPGPNGETFSIRQLAEDFQQKGKFYRVIQGEDAFRDVVESGLVRTNAAAKVVPGATLLERLKERPTAFPSFSKDYAAMSYAQSNPDHYIIVTDDASLQPSTSGRHSKGKTHFPTNAQGEHLSSLPADKVDVFRHIGDGMYELAYSRGNLISEENTGKPVETFLLRSVSPSQDAEYMTAVEAGDMETAQRMVDEAAEKAGLPILNENEVTAYKVRRKPAPKKTEKAYKLFRVKKGSQGEVFALFVGANDPLPQGIWLDATEGPRAEDSKTGKAKVKSKLGPLAYRPGWHAGDVPLATHIGASDIKGGPIVGRKFDEVWAEVEMASDVDYQPEANANGVTKDGSISVALADIKKMPEDGLYRYKTNPNMTGQWIISGSMKINRILSENEVNSILEKASLQTMPWMEKPQGSKTWSKTPLNLEQFGLGTNPAANQKKLLDTVTYDDAGNVIPLSQRFNPDDNRITYSIRSGAAQSNEPSPGGLSEAGVRLNLFHGNTPSFGRFARTPLGIHLGSEDAARDRIEQTGQNNAVITEYSVELNNPVSLRYDPGTWMVNEVFEALPQDVKKQVEESFPYDISDLDYEDLKNELQGLGFDGIKYPNAFEGRRSKSYLVFEENQIHNIEVNPESSRAAGGTFSLRSASSADARFRFDGIAKEDPINDGSRVGTAWQGKVKPTTQNTNNGIATVTPKGLKKQMGMLTQFIDGVPLPKYITDLTDPTERMRAFIAFQKGNLLALYDAFEKLSPDYVVRSTHWYDGARLLAERIRDSYGLTVEQSSAIIAVFSPMKDWFQNVAMGQRFADIMANYKETVITKNGMRVAVDEMVNAAENGKYLGDALKLIEGRTIANLLTDKSEGGRKLAAVAVRLLSTHVHGLTHDVLTPEGESMGVRKNLDGSNKKIVWQSYAFIVKAISIYENGSLENISKTLGTEHKIRNFYNNIISPTSPFGDATVDTHAVNAAVLFPMGGSAYLTTLNFGDAGMAGGGNSGLYWLFHEALREAAAERGVLPRQMQSITWEAIRGLFPDTMKRNKKFVAKIVEIWESSSNAESARSRILELGITAPEWARVDSSGAGSKAGMAGNPGQAIDSEGSVRSGVRQGRKSGASSANVSGTFSLRSGDFASRMSAAFSPFQRNPELRLAIAQVAKARALKLGAEWIEKASLIRSAGDIGKEARMREALAYETRMNDYMDGLTPNARQTLEFEPSALEDDPLVSAMLDYGKLMSFTNAKKAGKVDAKAGDYDGVPWLPSSFYSKGAGIMPDQMAQAMNDAGLLPDAYADTLWNELGKRIASTKKDKAAHREAVSAYKAAQKYARDASRAEADQWAEGAKKKAGSPNAQRDMLKAALRTLDGILAAAPPEVRAKVGGYVKLAGLATDEAMLQEIERRIEKLNVELEKYLKKEGIEQIEKLFKKARPDSEAGKKDKGKNADMHALFAAAERAAKMDEVAVAGELARLDSFIGGDTLTAEQEALAITERGIVELVGDLKHADAGRVFSALDTLRDIYEGGWIKWKLAQIEKREERAGMRAAFIADTGKSGIKPERDAAEREAETLLGKIKGGFLSLSSFHEVLNYAFGSNSARVKSLVDAEREAAGQYEDVNQALADEVQDLFTGLAGGKVLAGEKLRFDMAQRTIQTAKGELSQLGAIQALLMWRQEDGRRHMEGQLGEDGKPISSWSYDQAWIDEITAQLTPEARSVMAWIMQKYGAEHAVLNPLYRQRYGVNMPAHDNYAPITVQPVQAKAGEVIDPVSGAAMSSGSILTPGSLRTRSRNAIAEPEFRDALQTLLMHTRQLEYWKAYYDLALESSAILGNREVLNSVKAKGGEQAATALRKWIDAIAQGGFRDASASLEMNKMLQRMTGRAASVGLLGRFSTLIVQSTQLAAASVKMPIGAYISGFVRLWAGLIPGLKMSNIWGDAIRSPFIQRRYKSAPPIVRQAMEGLAAASGPNQIKRATRALGQLLSGTDALFTAGTYALLLDYHRGTGRALGLTGADLEEHAHTEAQRDTEQVAQPTRMAARSLAEITSTNPLAKVSWAYASEARQKIALLAWATTKVKSEPAQFAKTAFLVFGVGGLLTQVLKGLWREAKGDDDEKKWSAERLTLAALTGPLHGVPLASELMGDQGMLSGVAWAWPALKDVASGEADMRDVDTLLSTLGLFNDTAAAVASLSHAGLDAAKVIENLADKK